MEKKIQTIATFRCNRILAHLDEVTLRDGNTGQRLKIDHPEAAAVIPMVSDDEIIMVRQFRYALGGETLELPAGKVDPGENPEQCARRELKEETGYKAETLKLIYTYAPAIGYSNELIHIFSGHNLQKVNDKIDEREIQTVERMSISRIEGLIKQGLILDGKTLIGLFFLGLLTNRGAR